VNSQVAIRGGDIDQPSDVVYDHIAAEAARRYVAFYLPYRYVAAAAAHFQGTHAHNLDVAVSGINQGCSVDIRNFYVASIAIERFHVCVMRDLHIELGVSAVALS